MWRQFQINTTKIGESGTNSVDKFLACRNFIIQRCAENISNLLLHRLAMLRRPDA